ncbi:MSHA biogenesis protein MshQ [Vibrio azureus]|uniref:DUF6701 domain-containing protein n=1 Tax=Vibrio azureus NBRC 104587 TaxID=1219077 RepID=U3AP15_9VIBR|nr:DUF6701 domain-containing protein [Vibrio azureus]AUI87071.1 MSHA biogenesis protein MshQ [Vibrio azureus]GAD75520.1 hypothetical protein VAZ01S_026_00260 [Vibrio azureus NBRC 104587]
MKLITFFFVFMLLPSFVFASQCDVEAKNDFTVSFNTRGSDDYQSVVLRERGYDFVLWYTGPRRFGDEYQFAFNEAHLNNGLGYKIILEYVADAKQMKYYRQLIGETHFELLARQYINLSTTQPWSIGAQEQIENLQCVAQALPDGPDQTINTSPKFEFGTLKSSNCNMSGGQYVCTIAYEKHYDESKPKPLVFVMPTIDASLTGKPPRRSEYPSTVAVVETTHQMATVVQEFAPHASADKRVQFLDGRSSEVQKEMAKVDYFVIEPGVLELVNGAKIVAGTLETNIAASQYNAKGNNERMNGVKIDFESYGLKRFNDRPGVLVQPQTRNNNGPNNWFTGMARDATERFFTIALEKSEVFQKNRRGKETFNTLSKLETVAFVAGEGHGYIDGQRFWLGQGLTEYTLDQKDPVIDPISKGCKVYTPFPDDAGFESPPILIANKNSRKGNNGGWLRRCSITKDSVGFIVEEDMQRDKERGHLDEEVGWFMFEKANPNPICDVFHSPVQTWKIEKPEDGENGFLILSNRSKIHGAPIIKDHNQRRRVLGFLPGRIWGQNKSDACDGFECFGDEGLLVGKESLESFPVSSTWQDVIITSEQRVTFQDGKQVKNLAVDGELTLAAGRYWFDTVQINTGGKLFVTPGTEVVINTKAVSLANRSFMGMKVDTDHDAAFKGNMRVNVYNLPIDTRSVFNWVDISNNSQFIGVLYSEKKVYLSNHSSVYGAITAPEVDVNNDAEIHSASSCLAPTDDYQLTLSPHNQYALLCGSQGPTFAIETTNQGSAQSTGLKVDILPKSAEPWFRVKVANNIGQGTYPYFTTESNSSHLGQLALAITVEDSSKIDLNTPYVLKVTMDEDTNKSQEATFKLLPFQFSVDDQNIVAGQEYPLTTKILACLKGQQTVVKSYTGKPSVTLNLDRPPSGRKEPSLLTYAPQFTSSEQGISRDKLVLMESGQFTVKLEDDNFICDPRYSDHCPMSPDQQPTGETLALNGSFLVQSRPWKIVACDIHAQQTGQMNPATQESGAAFMPSAESFSVTFKAIIHRTPTGTYEQSCTYPSTQNYFTEGNLQAAFQTEFAVAYPIEGELANLSTVNGESLEFTRSEAINGKQVTYSWNEVGSLNLATNASYLGMNLEPSSVTVGRFYPKYFRVISSEWHYPGQQGFIYMNQPFEGVKFEVEALNGLNQPVQNYVNFMSQAEFNLAELEHYAERFEAPKFGPGAWNNQVGRSVGLFSIGGSHHCSEGACWQKDLVGSHYPDGPFNSIAGGQRSQIGLVYENNADPVAFFETGNHPFESRLVLQPDIRFGRIDLDDVGGNQGDHLQVPLRVEYWNGERFVNNIDDDQTTVIGAVSKQQVIWPLGKNADPQDVQLIDGGQVSSGYLNKLVAFEAAPYRQQTRVWLGLEEAGNDLPWLKYRWEGGKPEEQDPSSVVTFGIHRGHDKVIYRAEPGITEP